MVAKRSVRSITALAALGLLATGMGIPPATADDVLVRGNLPMSMGLRFGPDGNLYVCTAAGLAVLDVTQGQLVDMIGPERGVLVPEDVIFGPDGSMYWAAMFVGDLGRRAPDGTVTTQMIGPGVNSLAFDAAGRLFVTEPWITDTLYLVDPTLQQPPQLLAQGLGGLKNMEFGPDGMMYGALMWQGRVVRIDVGTTPVTVETVAEGIPGPFTARFGPDGMLYVVERTGFTVQRMDPTTGVHSTYASLPFGPDNIAFAPTGAMFVSSYSDGTVAVVLPDGSVQTVVPGGLTLPSGVAVRQRADGESVFVGNLFALREYDGATGAELGVERFRFPPVSFGGAVSVAAAGENLVLTNFFPPGQGRVQVWDPVAAEVVLDVPGIAVPVNAIPFGDDLVVVDLGMGEGQARVLRVAAGGTTVLADINDNVVVPLGLASRDDDLWVGDWYTGMIWQLIADGQELPQPVPAASGLSGPEGMAVDRDGSLLVVEGTAGRVSRIRLETGAVTPVVSGLQLSLVGAGMLPPFGLVNGIAVGSSGAVYLAGDLGNLLYKLTPQTLYLPGAANNGGLKNSLWTTDLELHNRGDVQASYTVELLVRGQANPAPVAVPFELAPQASVRYANVLDELFDYEGGATLRISSVRGEIMASARTRTDAGTGFYGQYIEAMDEATAAGNGDEVRLIQLESSAAARTNIGLVSACGVTSTVEVRLNLADGTPAGELSLELEPFETVQVNDVFGSLGGGQPPVTADDAYAVVTCATPDASFFAYASVVDNGTNDPIFVPGR